MGLDNDKNLSLEKSWDKFPLEKWRESKLNKLRRRNLIVSADPSSAVTMSYPVEMKRAPEDRAIQLGMIELENLLSQSIGKEFGPGRAEAASRLGLHELDTVLGNAEADNFKIDGHAVVNPLSFPGKIVGGVMRLTFASRPFFDQLKYFFGSGDGFFFTSDARAGLFLLSRLREREVNLAIAGNEGVSCFSFAKSSWGSVIYEDKFNWLHDSLVAALVSEFKFGRETASLVYEKYLAGNVSEGFGRFLGKTIRPEMNIFLSGLKSSRLKGEVFLPSPLPLPINYPSRCGRLTLCDLPAGEVADKLGFRLNFSEWPMSAGEVFMRLAPFFEFYYDKHESEINHRLRRRIHWLVQ